ncbi:MAG: chromosome partitioning protein ParB, partial [Gammaproteobacteria bacterium]
MQKKRGLGRGLDALLSSARPDTAGVAQGQLRNLPVDLIQRGKYQPRKNMHAENLQDLADSIRAQGVVQP